MLVMFRVPRAGTLLAASFREHRWREFVIRAQYGTQRKMDCKSIICVVRIANHLSF
jgi:hypothetical protein